MIAQFTLKSPRENEKFWRTPDRWPMEAAGFVFLANAFHQIGRAMFGNKWTGDEAFIEQPRLMAIAQGAKLDTTTALETASNRQSSAFGRGWLVQRKIASLAQGGQLATAWRARAGGDVIAMPAAYWNTEQLSPRFYWCQMSLSQPFSSGVGGDSYGWIFVTSDTLNGVLSGLHVDTAATKQPAERPKSRAGSKKKFDWDEGKLFAFKLLNERGDFEDFDRQNDDWRAMADLEKLVLQHVAKEKYRTSRVDVEPSTSSVRRYVTKWVKEWRGSQ